MSTKSPDQTPDPRKDVMQEVEATRAANIVLDTENAQLRKALRVIRKGLSEGADGEFWSARNWLDTRGIFNGDLSGYRVLELVAKHALHDKSENAEREQHQREIAQRDEHIGVLTQALAQHGEFGGLFQPGGRFHRDANLMLGRSAVVEGGRWLVAQYDQQAETIRQLREELGKERTSACNWMEWHDAERDKREAAEARCATLTEALESLIRQVSLVASFAQSWEPLTPGDIKELRQANDVARAALAAAPQGGSTT